MGLTVKAFDGLDQQLKETRGKTRTRGRPPQQTEPNKYRTFTSAASIQSAMDVAIADAQVTDDALITAYERVVAGGLVRQGDGEMPWTFQNQTGVNRDAALRLELAGLIKTGRKGSMVARIFFLDAGNVRRVKKDSGIDAVVAMLQRNRAAAADSDADAETE